MDLESHILIVKPELPEIGRCTPASHLLHYGSDDSGLVIPGLAHDFRNHLHVISTLAQLLQRRTDVPANASLCQAIVESTQKCDKMLEYLDARGRHDPENVSVKFELRKSARLYSKMLELNGLDLVLQTHDTYAVNCDAVLLERAIRNLVVNAMDAMPEDGAIILGSNDVNYESAHNGLSPGKYVRLFVQDFGEGMEPDKLKKIFKPFFTTKETGTGLGLYVVYSTVCKYDGVIKVDTSKQGTRFSLYFPASD